VREQSQRTYDSNVRSWLRALEYADISDPFDGSHAFLDLWRIGVAARVLVMRKKSGKRYLARVMAPWVGPCAQQYEDETERLVSQRIRKKATNLCKNYRRIDDPKRVATSVTIADAKDAFDACDQKNPEHIQQWFLFTWQLAGFYRGGIGVTGFGGRAPTLGDLVWIREAGTDALLTVNDRAKGAISNGLRATIMAQGIAFLSPVVIARAALRARGLPFWPRTTHGHLRMHPNPDLPLWPKFKRGRPTTRPMSSRDLTACLRSLFRRCGHAQADEMTLHGPRASAVGIQHAAGFERDDIKMAGGWRSYTGPDPYFWGRTTNFEAEIGLRRMSVSPPTSAFCTAGPRSATLATTSPPRKRRRRTRGGETASTTSPLSTPHD